MMTLFCCASFGIRIKFIFTHDSKKFLVYIVLLPYLQLHFQVVTDCVTFNISNLVAVDDGAVERPRNVTYIQTFDLNITKYLLEWKPTTNDYESCFSIVKLFQWPSSIFTSGIGIRGKSFIALLIVIPIKFTRFINVPPIYCYSK